MHGWSVIKTVGHDEILNIGMKTRAEVIGFGILAFFVMLGILGLLFLAVGESVSDAIGLLVFYTVIGIAGILVFAAPNRDRKY